MRWVWGWEPYVPVAERRLKAMKQIQKMQKKGRKIQPVVIDGRTIASTFWGKAWCENLEAYSDFSNRIPRGRTYVRNGSVLDLRIEAGLVQALVSGSDLYQVEIKIDPLPAKTWKTIRGKCAGQILSLPDLLRGRLPQAVMELVTRPQTGLFPAPREIAFSCSCPDWASMCKHVAAVLYGIGARLDQSPELLFELRGVDHRDLIAPPTAITDAPEAIRGRIIAESELEGIFGIDIAAAPATGRTAGKKPVGRPRGKTVKTEAKKTAAKIAPPKQPSKKAVESPAKTQRKTGKALPKAVPKKKSRPGLPDTTKVIDFSDILRTRAKGKPPVANKKSRRSTRTDRTDKK